LRQRIVGTESEYASVCHGAGDVRPLEPGTGDSTAPQEQIAARLMACRKALGIPMAGEFLGNGGRLYLDRGGHPEYATPECRRVADLVAHEIAGDRLVRELADVLNSQDRTHQVHVYKNNVDFYGHTYGGHENYLITPKGLDDIARLLPFLVTRQIYTGAGKAMLTARDGAFGFQISQRADFFDCTYSDRTSDVRGIINIRKREITRGDQNRRLHLIIGDSNLAHYSIGLKIGTSLLMLSLLEADALDPDLELLSPAPALKAVSRDLNAKIAVRRRGRRGNYSALEIQSLCLDKALRFFAVHAPGAEEVLWLRAWEETLEGLTELKVDQANMAIEQDGADLKRRIDWVLKLWLLDRGRSKGADERQLKKLDLKYHDLDPKTGLYERCLALDLVDRLVSEAVIQEARCQPPGDTRAQMRGRVVQQAFSKKVDVDVENWARMRVKVRVDEPGARHFFKQVKQERNSLTIDLEDPFQARDPEAFENLRQFIEKWG
jgi:proteasome accessory factor A